MGRSDSDALPPTLRTTFEAASRAKSRSGMGRPLVLARVSFGKNWLFAGSLHVGRRAAALMRVMASCRVQDIAPFAYLKDVLVRITTGPADPGPELTVPALGRAPLTDLAARAVVGMIHGKPVPRETLARGAEAYTTHGTRFPRDAVPATGWIEKSSDSSLRT